MFNFKIFLVKKQISAITLLTHGKKYLVSVISPQLILLWMSWKTVLNNVTPSKAFGPDNIPAIIWKDDHFYELLLNLCNFCAFEHKRCPSFWRKSHIIPVPKKGDLSLVTNYRGISLIQITAKI